MKAGRNLTDLAAEIERQAESKRDFVAPVGRLAVVPAGNTISLGLENGKSKDLMPLNNLAHGNLAEFTGIPKAYYDKMLAEAPGLLATNANTWFERMAADPKVGSRLVRTLDGRVRALLSDRYRPLENFDLASAVLPVLMEQSLEIISCEVTERRLYIKAADKRINRDIPSGRMGDGSHVIFDTVSPAIVISNSEVGCGSLSIETAVWTKACTNLAIFSQRSMRKYHTGGRAAIADGVYELLTDDTKRLTDKAVWAQVRDLTRSAFDQAKFDASLEGVKAMTGDRIEGDPVKAVEVARVHFGFSKEQGSGILRRLVEGGDLTRYGLFNAVTRAAEDQPDYDDATEMERTGGKVIELPRNDWERIARAA